MEWAKGGAEKQRCTTKKAANGGVASRFKLRVPQLTPERQPHENRRTAPRHCKSAGGSNGYGHHLDGAYADTPGSHGNATAPDIATGTATMRRRTGQHFDTRTKRTCSVRGGVAADGKNSNCANLSTATALAISFWRLRHAIDLIGFTSNPSRYSFSSCLRRGGGRCGQFWPNATPSFLAQHLSGDDAARLRFNPPSLGWPHVAPASQALVQVLLACIELFRPIAPDFRGNFNLHARKSSVTLPDKQAFCIFQR